jgi:hypothetical protein
MPRVSFRWFALLWSVAACSSDDGAGSSTAATGGQPASGGAASPSGGTGTSVSTTGGTFSAGGAGGSASGTGGVNASGGSSSGGSATGGVSATGGTSSGGTTPGSGGASSGGATPGSGGTSSGGTGTGGSSSGGTGAGGASTGGAASCAPPAAGSRGKNPLFTDQYTADPAPFVDGCTFYINCGHDEGNTGFVMREWFILSSTDMVNWTKQVALKVSDFRWANANAWAGQMVSKGGKYYWYVPVNQTGAGMAIGVAVADSPKGPFKDAIGKALVDDAFEMSNMGFTRPDQTVFTIDPSVLVDDDGQAYLLYGGFGRLVVTKLGADMTSISGTMREVTPRGFFEAPFLVKNGGKYYVIYAAGSNPATIDYATSANPLGPWTYGGRILDQLPTLPGQDASTSHPGVARFAGEWYLVYHLSNGPNGGGTYRREVAVDKLTFNADGTIKKVVPTSGLTF